MNALRRALRDIGNHRFLNLLTIATIALSVLIVSAFALFFTNTGKLMETWKSGIRVMVYLKADLSDTQIQAVGEDIRRLAMTKNMRFISKEDALAELKGQLEGQSSLFESLDRNPLPDAYEIEVKGKLDTVSDLDAMAAAIGKLPSVDGVEYGRQWVERFVDLFNLFRLAACAMGGLFFMAAVFIVANTVRLVLYSRAEEVEILRLVGATDGFINAPFYIEGLIQGAMGAVIGLACLFAIFSSVASQSAVGLLGGMFQLRFLPPSVWLAVIAGSMFVGWLGCFLSLRHTAGIDPSERSR